jgi:2-hydroxy-6-oxonona-2,4-dienedioate hydrolase
MDSIWLNLMGVAPMKHHYLNVKGLRVRCLEAGDGPPLLLMHGGGGHLEAYARNIEALAAHFHVYAVDLIGHGYTDRPPIGRYSFMTIVKFIGDLQETLGHDKVNICGLSISAMSAGVYAGQNPDRVSQLLLNCGVPLLADEEGRTRWRASIEMRHKVTAQGSWSREAVRARLGRVFHSGEADVPDELVDVRYRIYNQPGFTAYNNQLVEDLLREIIEENDFTMQIGPQAMRDIRCPVTLLWTTTNPGQGMGVAKEAMSMLRHGKLAIFDRSGHWPQWEQPADYNDLVLKTMAGVQETA